MSEKANFSFRKVKLSLWERLAILLKDEGLSTLRGWKKVGHILAYYKFALLILCVVLYFIGYNLYRHFTQKEVLLYIALVNVVTGEDLTRQLGEDFTAHLKPGTAEGDSDCETHLYTGLYLTDDELNAYHEYTYASRMKILAAIEGRQMDVVLMNREAFDAFSQNGYLYDLDSFLPEHNPALYEILQPDLVSNIVILEDNADDLALDASVPYTSVTEEHLFGLDLSGTELIARAGFEDTVYLGVIANSPRADTVISYLQYLTTKEPSH